MRCTALQFTALLTYAPPQNFDPVSGERTDLDALGQPAVVGTRPPPYDSYGRGGSYSDRSFGDRGYSSRPGYPERDGERDRYYEREYSYGGSGGYGGDDRAYVPPERDYLPAERDYGAVDRYAPPGRSYPSRAAAAYDDYDDYPPSAGGCPAERCPVLVSLSWSHCLSCARAGAAVTSAVRCADDREPMQRLHHPA